MNLISIVKSARWKHWRGGINWLLFTLLGGLLPIYGGFIVIITLPTSQPVLSLVDNGEFAIYSASLLSTGMLVLLREYIVKFDGREIVGLLTLVLLVFATIIFVVVTVADGFEILRNIDRAVLRKSSLVIFGLTLLLTFLLSVAKEYLDDPSIPETGAGALQREFESLGGR